MLVRLSRSDAKGFRDVPVSNWREASDAVQDYIAEHDLGAGCSDGSPAFTGGKVFNCGRQVGRISYNGCAWDKDGNEVKA